MSVREVPFAIVTLFVRFTARLPLSLTDLFRIPQRMTEVVINITCGFCFQTIDGTLDSKKLPCTHIHCTECLLNCYETKHLLVCGTEGCGEVYELSPSTLPPYDAGDDNKWCSVCEKKGDGKQEAVIYCTQCLKRFCKQHLESHDALLEDHPKINMLEYRALNAKMQSNTCEKHNDQVNILGCKICKTICCAKCIPELGSCDNSTYHTLIPTEDLVAIILADGAPDCSAKEDKYEEMFKSASKLQADYDSETAALRGLIHKTRDAQLMALKLQYDEMEKQLLENRLKSKMKIAEFLEEALLQKWSQLRDQRQMLESKVKHAPLADIVRRYDDWKQVVERLSMEEYPSLRVSDQLKVKERGGERGGIELELVSSQDITIGDRQSLESPIQLCPVEASPTSTSLDRDEVNMPDLAAMAIPNVSPDFPTTLQLLTCVQLPGRPVSVCQYNTETFVGLNDSVCIIDRDYEVYDLISSVKADSISVYEASVYILSCSTPCKVGVYDLSGTLKFCWYHPDHSPSSDMLTVNNDRVYIADPHWKRIIVYTLTGEVLRSIQCGRLNNTNIAMCAGDEESLVLSDFYDSTVFKIDVKTGSVVWTVSMVNDPGGIVKYGEYVFLAARNNNEINIINITTGLLVSSVSDRAIAGDSIYSLDVFGSILIVPKYGSRQIRFYEMS